MTEKQTKLASYWNTPLNKICLGMKVNGVAKWIMINHQASSLFSVIADGVFKNTYAGKETWKSLIAGSILKEYCNKEGFNLQTGLFFDAYMNVRIGILANDLENCHDTDTVLGFGISVNQCTWSGGIPRKATCGNMAICDHLDNFEYPVFGYIFVQ